MNIHMLTMDTERYGHLVEFFPDSTKAHYRLRDFIYTEANRKGIIQATIPGVMTDAQDAWDMIFPDTGDQFSIAEHKLSAEMFGNNVSALAALQRFGEALGDDLESDDEIHGSDVIEFCSAWWPNAKEALGGGHDPLRDEFVPVKRSEEDAITLLTENLIAWEDEEESVKDEHSELIDRTRRFLDRG